MLSIPAKYRWLLDEEGPRILKEALKTYGVQEAQGTKNNPTILSWAKSIGLKGSYKADSIPWCGLTVSYWAAQAGYPHSPNGNALWARNWLAWENPAPTPMLGDVLVFARGSAGHVALYVGEDSECFHILGGNQGDMVNIKRKPKSQLLGARRRRWVVNQPANIRRVFLSPSGTPTSDKEA